MAITFKKDHKSFSSDDIVKLCTGEAVVPQQRTPVDKTSFYKAPEGLTQFKTPNKNVMVHFDVLEFCYTNKYNKKLMDAGIFDAVGTYYWNYQVHVHECFPKTVVCHRNFELGKTAKRDPVCSYMWEHKEVDFKAVNKTYMVMLLRVHPNTDLGITDYTYMYHIDTNGKLAQAIQKAWDKVVARKDFSKANFFKWDETGCTVEAFFSELASPNGIKYWGCDDVTFIPREKQLDDTDAEFLYNVDMCGGISEVSSEEYADFMQRFKEKAPIKHGQVVESYDSKVVEQPVNKVATDPVFTETKKEDEACDDDWING